MITAAELVVIVKADLTQMQIGLAAAQTQLGVFNQKAATSVTTTAQGVSNQFKNITNGFTQAVGQQTAALGQATAAAATASTKAATAAATTVNNVVGNTMITIKQAAVQATQSMSQIERGAVQMSAALSSQFGVPAGAIRGLGMALGPVAIIIAANAVGMLALTEIVKAASQAFEEYGQKIYKVSQATGISTKDTQILGAEAQLTGSNIDQLQRGLIYLSKQMDLAAQGNKQATQRLHDLGVETSDYKGRADALQIVLNKVSDTLANTANGYEKASIASKEFSRFGGSDLIPLLNQLHSQGFLTVEGDLKRYGLLLDDEGVAKSHNLMVETTKLSMAWEGFKVKLGEELYPVIVNFLGAIQNLIVDLPTIVPILNNIVTAFLPLIKVLEDAVTLIAKIHEYSEAGKSVGFTGQYQKNAQGGKSELVNLNEGFQRIAKPGISDAELGKALALVNKEAVQYDQLQEAYGGFGQNVAESNVLALKLLTDQKAKVDAALENVKNMTNVTLATGTGQLDLTGAGKKTNTGEEAMQRAKNADEKARQQQALQDFRDFLAEQQAELAKFYETGQIAAASYYDGLTALANEQYQVDKHLIEQDIADLQKQADAKKLAAASAGDEKTRNKLLEEYYNLDRQIADEESKLSAAHRKYTEEKQKDDAAIIKAGIEYQKVLQDQQIELGKLLGTDDNFQSKKLAAEKEYDDYVRKWNAERAAAEQKLLGVHGQDVALATVELDTAKKIRDIKIAAAALADIQTKAQTLLTSTVTEEANVRRQILLGTISDKDAEDDLARLHDQKLIALKAELKAEQDLLAAKLLSGTVDEKLVNNIEELKKRIQDLTDQGMSNFKEFLVALAGSTKTFSEQWSDAIQQLGKDLHTTLASSLDSLLKGDYKGFLTGLITGFRDAIAKMAADLLASQLLKLLKNVLQNVFGITFDQTKKEATAANTTATAANTGATTQQNTTLTTLITTEQTLIATLRELIAALQSGGGTGGNSSGGSGGGLGKLFGTLFGALFGAFGLGGGPTGSVDVGFSPGDIITPDGGGAMGGWRPAGRQFWVGEDGPEVATTLPGGGAYITGGGKKSGNNSQPVEYHTHYWYVSSPTPESFLNKPSQLQIERQASRSVDRGRKHR